jgi:hypothetical protein
MTIMFIMMIHMYMHLILLISVIIQFYVYKWRKKQCGTFDMTHDTIDVT